MRRILESTLSICSVCGKVVPADLESDNTDVYIIKNCPEHGAQRLLYWKDSAFFQAATRLVPTQDICANPECLASYSCSKHLAKTTDLMLNFTDRCNYRCPACFASSAPGEAHEPSLEEIFSRLPRVNGPNRPTLVIIGGEPTLREDLPELIEGLVRRGFYPRLTTNGLRLNDDAYLRRLRGAGLEWIILQFDGFSDPIHERLRGRPLNRFKEELIPRLERFGFKIHLAVMTVRGVNLPEVGRIVEFALRHDRIIWLSFYPHATINRDALGDGDTHVVEVMDALEEQSGGRIGRQDFLEMMKVFRLLHRLFRIQRFKPKMSIFSLLVVSDGKEYFPVTRLLRPGFAVRHLSTVLGLARSLPSIVRYQKRPFPANLIAVNIEKFHNRETIDLREASNCHMSFITRDGYVPFDIYNNLFRRERNW